MRGRPRAPGALLGAVSLMIVVLVATLALTARAVPPPTVAEFAPQAIRQITDPQPGLEGPGPSGGGERGPGGSPDGGENEEVVDTQRVRRCIGDPPRQIEDPQSPPCVPFSEGDNGGATWKGVTGTEIRVAVANHVRAHGGTEVDAAEYDRAIEIYEQFFNRRFWFYNRTLNLIPYTPARNAASGSQMQADAVRVDEEIGAFAAVHYSEQDGRQNVFFDALAERKLIGIVSAPGGVTRNTEADLRRARPYLWQYLPTSDRLFAAHGEFICNVLAGKPATYADGPERDHPKRAFGIIVDTSFADAAPYDIEPLRRALRRCDAPLHEVAWDTVSAPTTVLLALREKDVTSIMYTGQGGILALRVMPAAAAQNYHPEWLMWSVGYQDQDEMAGYWPKSEIPQVLGTSGFNKTLRPADMARVWAAREIDPTFPAHEFDYEMLYKNLLLLASGIQMAGPQLTPETFEAGLMRTRFPNPGAGGPPYYQARVGFPGVHSMQQDLGMIWLSGTERSPSTEVPPAYCYADRGTRYGLGAWPHRDVVFFDGPCR